MVHYRRNFLAGGTFFFTATTADRRSSVLVDYADLLRQALRVIRRERPFLIDAVVVLPDHLHTIITLPPGDADFSGRWRRFKSLFTRLTVASGFRCERNRRGEYALWQRRFWEHTIRDESDFARHADYIHYNPVRHGFVSQASDWPHSSFRYYVRAGVLPKDWGGRVDEKHNFGEPPA
jgi:putative transposase